MTPPISPPISRVLPFSVVFRSIRPRFRKKSMKTKLLFLFVLTLTIFVGAPVLNACTGISLTGKDGAVLYGRTMEWGAFDLQSRLNVIPRGLEFTGSTPDGKPGIKWSGKHGVVAIDALHKLAIMDGLNEKGLTVGTFYHPGVAEYETYEPAKSSESLGPTEVAHYLLTTCATVDEARAAINRIRVVPVVEPALGFTPGVHFMVSDKTGKHIVIEFLKGKTTVFDAPLGVITNAPSYDWHITNLRNYINLSPVALPGKKIEDLDFKPLGGGSGMIGLPGDFTPPSRFVRAVAFSQTARPTKDGPETRYEMFRILDNFNVPLGASEGSTEHPDPKLIGMRSSTLWTVVSDTKNLVLYYHTQNNRRVRMVDVGAIDFNTLKGPIQTRPLDEKREEDIETVIVK